MHKYSTLFIIKSWPILQLTSNIVSERVSLNEKFIILSIVLTIDGRF